MMVLVKPDAVEDEEFNFRTPVADIGDTARLQVLLGFLRDKARVPAVGFARDRI
jgi:hypothetical protein